ncbi:hypothetical protein ACHAPI_011624 [Fusarium lateritium]
MGLASLCGRPKTKGASESTPESSASRLRVELLDIDLDGDIVLGEDMDGGGAGESVSQWVVIRSLGELSVPKRFSCSADVAGDGIVELLKQGVNLRVVEALYQLKQLVYRPAAMEAQTVGCHPFEASLIE